MTGDGRPFSVTPQPDVTFFTEAAAGKDHEDEVPGSTRSNPADKLKSWAPAERNLIGLGNGPGGQITRSFLGARGSMVMDTPLPPRIHRGGGASRSSHRASSAESKVFEGPTGRKLQITSSISDVPEPQGMFLGLLLDDASLPSEQDLLPVQQHRWNFHGAMDMAKQGRGFCFFMWCLLDLQRNVQLNEEGDALDPKLVVACKTFVIAQCRKGNMGSMYQVLAHFISNSLVFHEWERFLHQTLEDKRAGQESFLVPNLEQVWGRFCRFANILENIFDVLNTRYVWRHRLPKVGDLVNEHMKRRCFSSEAVLRNELFNQATSRNETIKQIKFAFGLQ